MEPCSLFPSVLLLSSGTVTIASTNDPLNGIKRIVQKPLGVSHVRVKVALTSNALI